MKKRIFVAIIALIMLCTSYMVYMPSVGAETVQCEQWRVCEIEFVSTQSHSDPYNEVTLNMMIVTGSGETLKRYTVPCFWNGGNTWVARFALSETGVWTYKTSAQGDTSLNGLKGSVNCVAYSGDLDIYKHGFVKTQSKKTYFMYDDGTPFFYLGDWHVHIMNEGEEQEGDRLDQILQAEQEQGFTVIQTQTLGGKYDAAYGNTYMKNLFTNGLEESVLEDFKYLDTLFEKVADYGFVNACSLMGYATELGRFYCERGTIDEEHLERLVRYITARYSAYPVMWTTAQEVDDDFYYGDQQSYFDADTNPWKSVAEWINKYDPYKHPLSAHQENAVFVQASNSSFRDVSGHSWWASQFQIEPSQQVNFERFKDYYVSGQKKPVVNYESGMDHYWVTTFGARCTAWTSFLNGMTGYGYGSQNIWAYYTSGKGWNTDVKESLSDCYETYTDEEMLNITWQESLELPAREQLGILKDFMIEHDWYNLIPVFDDSDYFVPMNENCHYSFSRTADNNLFVGYLYSNNMVGGEIKGLNKNSVYTVEWFNPQTGSYISSEDVTIKDGTYVIAQKPIKTDAVIVLTYKGEAGANEPEFVDECKSFVSGEYIYNVAGRLTEENFKKTLKDTTDITIDKLSSKGFVSTGTQVTYGDRTYTVIVPGDVTGKGDILSTDYNLVKRNTAGKITLEGNQKLAADIDRNDKITSIDYIQIKKHVAGSISIWNFV